MSDSLRPHERQAAHQASLSITNSRNPPKPMSFELVNYLKRLYWICYNTTYVLCFGSLSSSHVGSQLPNQGSTPPHPLHWKVSLNHGTTREVLLPIYFR